MAKVQGYFILTQPPQKKETNTPRTGSPPTAKAIQWWGVDGFSRFFGTRWFEGFIEWRLFRNRLPAIIVRVLNMAQSTVELIRLCSHMIGDSGKLPLLYDSFSPTHD